MAIPFKVEHFLLRRQVQLEKEITENPLYRKLEACVGQERLEAGLLNHVARGCFLPEGFLPVLDEAVLTLKTVARLPYDIKVSLAPAGEGSTRAIGILRDKELAISIAPQLVQGSSSGELVFHLAAATFGALHSLPLRLAFLLAGQAPFELEQRLKAVELLRLMGYAVDCFGLVCCGSLETTLRAAFHWSTGLRVEPGGAEFRQPAKHSLQSGQHGAGWLLNEGLWQLDWSPLTPLMLAQFVESELYRAGRGESGGVSREQFEAAVLEMDRAAHPPLEELPAQHAEFVNLACLLATYLLMEAAGTVTKAREASLLEYFDLEGKQFEELAEHFGWRRGEVSNTRELLEQVLTGPKGRWSNLHGVRILERAFIFAAKEHSGPLPHKLQPALLELGRWLVFGKEEVVAVYESVMERILESQEQGE